VSVISTLAREEALFVFGDGPGFTDNPFFQKGLTPERLALLKTKVRADQANDPDRPRWLRMFDTDKKNLKKLADAGIRFGFGTDSGGALDRYFIQGFFEHRQMELMRDAGLTPMQIIQSFSKNNAEMLASTVTLERSPPARPPTFWCWQRIPSTTSPICARWKRSISAARNSSSRRPQAGERSKTASAGMRATKNDIRQAMG